MVPEWLKKDVPNVHIISKRLRMIISNEIDPNGFIRREIGAKTVFVMLYTFCVDSEHFIRPATITCMNDRQSKIGDMASRIDWLNTFQSRKVPKDIPDRWYMPNTREPIRDETLREMVRIGCVVEKEGLPTTSPMPRYSLQREFCELFNPHLIGVELAEAIVKWQEKNLSRASLARIALSKKMVTKDSRGVLVSLPNGETRKLSSGPSSNLIKAVVEKFSKKFLQDAVILLISESAKKIILKDDELLNSVGLNIDVSKALPDIIMMDLGCKSPLLFFIECVATDGPVSDRRKKELSDIALKAGFKENDCVYVTVFNDRASQLSKRLKPSIAWGTFVWYASEPDSIIYLYKGYEKRNLYIKDIINLADNN